MTFIDWALEQAVKHPKLEGAFVSASGEWLDVLLPDGRAFRFRPGALIKSDAPLEQRTVLLDRLIDVGVEQAEESRVLEAADEPGDGVVANKPADSSGGRDEESGGERTGEGGGESGSESGVGQPQDQGEAPIFPIVRAADYFLASHRGSDSMVYLPITDFLAVGIAHDYPDTIEPIYYSQLEDSDADIGEVVSEAVNRLRQAAGRRSQSVEIEVTEIAGARVMSFLQPANYEVSWFVDVEMTMHIAERISEHRPDDIPLFVPASRSKLYIVFADDPHLTDFFEFLLDQRDASDVVYPLPHTVAEDGWLEWQPFPGSRLADVLANLRNHYRQKIYRAQLDVISQWPHVGAVTSFDIRRLTSGERVSVTTWDASNDHGTIPKTDFVTFTRRPSPHPWEDVTPVNITVRTHVARELWPAGFSDDTNVWPPRYTITGFPDDDTLLALKGATDRQF
ncbi:hypothetical protein [Trueperella bialowiezensis]|uniref:Uncharacterized protein n=1 Tax=Trueperella bialowiezensis TaxID=312285 RepID=A0A448PEG0_9ACTO|nr:hypothetical protein [Trueperella bialowiezensis]VEI13280.1 Uncharacterised protein [Trueperella bialowiezensis]